ncbi:MAG: hypothetical protein R3330_09085 [Saprospiraceae bacterium]|nr:hypothetical protein [Saprospiraceae bacterium]
MQHFSRWIYTAGIALAVLLIQSRATGQDAGHYWIVTTVQYASYAQMDSMQSIVKSYQPRMLKALRGDGVVLDEIALFNEIGEGTQALFMHKLASWADIPAKQAAFRRAWQQVCSPYELNRVRAAFAYITEGVRETSQVYREAYSRN